MQDIERLLRNRKNELDRLEAPPELAARLAGALAKGKPVRQNSSKWLVRVAAICLAVLLIGYNFDTLAFYGKKLVGYDQVMSGTLRELNELGKGQLIGKGHTFPNGASVTLDGIMLDDSQLITFYTIHDPQGTANLMQYRPPQLKGFFKRYMLDGGQGEQSEGSNTIKWLMSFEPPFFLERTLHFSIAYMDGNTLQEGVISFKLERAKAMGSSLKKAINQTIELEQTKVRFDSILASPTRTVIYGTLQHFHELARDQLKGERLRPSHLAVRLIANDGEVIPWQGGGMSTDMRGIKFEQSFEALPGDLQKLQIQLYSLSVDRDANVELGLHKGTANGEAVILGQPVEIKNVYTAGSNTCVTITTDENTVLTRVYLILDGQKVALQQTVTDNLEKIDAGKILHTRTLHFPGTGENLALLVERITFTEYYNVILEIPVN